MASHEFTKVCFLFRPNDEAMRAIESIVQMLLGVDAPVATQDGNLPYHMTIIGGGCVPRESVDRSITEIISSIKPFSEGVLPLVLDVEPAQLFDGYLAIRLKLKGYVITGDRQKNKELRNKLQTHFHFDGPRHITLLQVCEDRRYQDMNEKMSHLENLLVGFRGQLISMRLVPEVWVKRPGSHTWQLWVRH